PMVRHFSSTGVALDAGVATTSTTPTPTPTPTPAPTLRGIVSGAYVPVSLGTGKGTRYDLVGISNLTGLGEVTLSGSLISTGSAPSSSATGTLVLHNSRGSITVSVVGPLQGSNSPLPSQFRFRVVSGTGAYTSFHSSGYLYVHLITTNHTLTLNFVPS